MKYRKLNIRAEHFPPCFTIFHHMVVKDTRFSDTKTVDDIAVLARKLLPGAVDCLNVDNIHVVIKTEPICVEGIGDCFIKIYATIGSPELHVNVKKCSDPNEIFVNEVEYSILEAMKGVDVEDSIDWTVWFFTDCMKSGLKEFISGLISVNQREAIELDPIKYVEFESDDFDFSNYEVTLIRAYARYLLA